jgi:hypothetical protein
MLDGGYKFKIVKFIIVFLTACNHPAKFNLVNINNKYSIEVPEYMEPATELKTEASLKYKNLEKDEYIIVIDESKSDFVHYNLKYNLENYFKTVAAQPFISSITHVKISQPIKKSVNGYNALEAELTGDINKNPVYYKLVIIETGKRFYQILTWTGVDYKEKHLPDMDKSIDSFKEL